MSLQVAGWVAGVLMLAGAAYGQPGKDPAGGPPVAVTADTNPVVSEVDLDAPLARVWEVFTTAEGFKLLGVAKAAIDLKVGGKILSHYDPAGVLGDEGTIENTIIAYEPQHVFAFRITRPPKGFPFMNAYKDVWSVATLTPIDASHTHLRLAMCGYTADEESQKMRTFFAQGNAWVMDKLRKNLEGVAAPKSDRSPAGAAPADPLAPIVAELPMPVMGEEVWERLTTTDGLRTFVPDARVQLQLGGPYEIYFGADAPAGQRGSEGCTVLSYEPGRMLSFSWNAPPKFAYARTQRTWVVVHIEPSGPHGSKVVLKHMGFAEKAGESAEHAEEWKQVRAYFAAAWPRFLGGLRESFEQKK